MAAIEFLDEEYEFLNFDCKCTCMVCNIEFITDISDANYICPECDEKLNKE